MYNDFGFGWCCFERIQAGRTRKEIMKHCWQIGNIHPAKCLKCGESASWDSEQNAWSMPFDGCLGEEREKRRYLPSSPIDCPAYFPDSVGIGIIICPVCGIIISKNAFADGRGNILHPMAMGIM